MALPGGHAAVLRRVSAELSSAGVRHGVGGSALLALLGLPVTVRDLDIEIDPGNRTIVADLGLTQAFSAVDPFAERGALLRTARGELGGSWMLRGSIDGVPVEIFEHYGIRSGSGWDALPLRVTTAATLGGDRIPLAETAFWWALYTRLDPAKAALLEPLTPAGDRRRAATEVGVPSGPGATPVRPSVPHSPA